MEGYFKIHRKILDSQVFAHPIALKIWVWMLARAGYSDRFVPFKINRGETIIKLQPGQFIFGRLKAEDELNIDGSTIYKWIQKFASEDFDMISIKSNHHYTIVTINHWEQYQNGDTNQGTAKEQPSDSQVTAKEQPSDSQVTAKEQPCNTNNKDKKDKEDKEDIYGEFYNSEIEKSNGDENYLKVVKMLHGENNLGIKLDVVLKIQHQLTYEQFKKLWYLKGKYKFSFTEIFERIQDWGNPKKRKTVYGVFLTFAKRDNPDIKLQ